MAAALDFYFDFSSPYGYLASTRIDELAQRHGRSVTWRPFLLGVVFKISKAEPLTNVPLKGDYAARDFARFARLLGVPFKMPAAFPFAAVAASRAVYWLADRDPAQARAVAKAVLRAGLGEGRDVTPAAFVVETAAAHGADRAAISAALDDPAVKDRLRVEVDAAIQRGVFGSPFVFADGEPFWGADRLDQVERWLATGGW
ncbi:MAG: 2-hydroxychromene-2-carboxylate isomerase [Pseudomonadota bacterium]